MNQLINQLEVQMFWMMVMAVITGLSVWKVMEVVVEICAGIVKLLWLIFCAIVRKIVEIMKP